MLSRAKHDALAAASLSLCLLFPATTNAGPSPSALLKYGQILSESFVQSAGKAAGAAVGTAAAGYALHNTGTIKKQILASDGRYYWVCQNIVSGYSAGGPYWCN